MKEIKPTQRHCELDWVLQFDSELQAHGKTELFTPGERIVINQERAALLAGESDYDNPVEHKIEKVLNQIKNQRWKPEEPIRYAHNYQ